MRLLLRRHVKSLGNIGDIVDVKNGYGRNYLIPHGYAVPVTVDNLRQIEIEKLNLARMEQEKRAAYEILAREIQRNSVTIKMRATETGELYGSVSERMISDAYKKLNIDFDYKCVQLEETIKNVGDYNAAIVLDKDLDIRCHAKIIVVEEGELR